MSIGTESTLAGHLFVRSCGAVGVEHARVCVAVSRTTCKAEEKGNPVEVKLGLHTVIRKALLES